MSWAPIGALHPSQPMPGLLGPDAAINLTNCDREPIHLSGAVQPHGALIAAGIDDFVITQASANTGEMLGMPADGLLGSALSAVLGSSVVTTLRDALHDPGRSRSIDTSSVALKAALFALPGTAAATRS